MRPGDLAMVSGNLQASVKHLREAWQDLRSEWNDPVAVAFEQQQLDPLEPHVHQTIKAMERLAAVFQRAYEACRE